MDIITTIIYVALFVIMMVFVFSIGRLRQFMPRKEIILVLIVAFLIGVIGGAFFLEPIYEQVPSVMSAVEKNVPGNEETLYLDLSSSVNMADLKDNLTKTEGFISFKENSITIPMWRFNEQELGYFNSILGNIDSHYKHYNITEDGKIQIELEDNYSSYEALKSFSDWYKLVYGGSLSYAQVHAVLVIESSHFDTFEKNLLEKGIVASSKEGPVQDSYNNTNTSMPSNIEFLAGTGLIGVIVAVLGIYYDSFGVFGRRLKKFFGKRRR